MYWDTLAEQIQSMFVIRKGGICVCWEQQSRSPQTIPPPPLDDSQLPPGIKGNDCVCCFCFLCCFFLPRCGLGFETGQMEQGKRHGGGKMNYTNGDQYCGTFKNDLFHGRCSTISNNTQQQYPNNTQQHPATSNKPATSSNTQQLHYQSCGLRVRYQTSTLLNSTLQIM